LLGQVVEGVGGVVGELLAFEGSSH